LCGVVNKSLARLNPVSGFWRIFLAPLVFWWRCTKSTAGNGAKAQRLSQPLQAKPDLRIKLIFRSQAA
jgi:hypothetical protein